MKKRILGTLVCIGIGGIVALAFFASVASAQTVAIGTIPASAFCSGDPISVSFTATGYWQHRNAFTLQLSDPTGSFTSGFTNLGSIQDTLPGTFTINDTIPGNLASSTHYRFRIMGALPYVTSADNGSDIAIGQRPQPSILLSQNGAVAGVSSMIECYDPPLSDTFYWNFGSGATPATDDGVGRWGDTVSYATGGVKIVTLQIVGIGGCPETVSDTFRVYDCTTPVIPHNAIVIDTDTVIQGVQGLRKNLWVNPGVTVTLSSGEDTVFAEPGSTVRGNDGGDIFYLKPGATLQDVFGVAIYADGANVGGIVMRLSCPSLDFDYTDAPPNAIMPAGVRVASVPIEVRISPNPATGRVDVDGLPENARAISLENVLGTRVGEWTNSGSHTLTLDLSRYPTGTYYVRFVSGETVITKKIVLE